MGIRAWVQIAFMAAALTANVGTAEVLELAELNTRQIVALDTERTVVIIPGGILEEHGPYLPSFSDGYVNLDESRQLAEDLSDRDWTVLMFPVIPLGSGGANEIGGKQVYPGTYAIRPETVRAIFMDIAMELGEQGFRNVFILHGHGSPAHNLALDQAGQFFKDEYDGQMHNLFGILTGPPSVRGLLTDEALEEDGLSMHAGLMETSNVMHARPGLVAADVGEAEPVTGQDFADLKRIAAEPGWSGYFGSPRRASAEIGASAADHRYKSNLELALRILDGDELVGMPRWSVIAYKDSEIQTVIDQSREKNTRRAARQRTWIDRNKTKL